MTEVDAEAHADKLKKLEAEGKLELDEDGKPIKKKRMVRRKKKKGKKADLPPPEAKIKEKGS